MIEAWLVWLLLLGLAVAVIGAFVLLVRLPRGDADVSRAERPGEAAWISATIERHGGVAPASLVEEVLDLHEAYLRDPRLGREPSKAAIARAAAAPPLTAPAPAPAPGTRSATAAAPSGPRQPPAGSLTAPGVRPAAPAAPPAGPSGPPTNR